MSSWLIGLLGFRLPTLATVDAVRPELVHGLASWVLVSALVGAVLIWFYRCEDRPVAAATRWLAMGLRVAFALLVALLLMQPRLQVTGQMRQHNQLAVLVDVSRSMSISERGVSRAAQAQAVLPDLLAQLEKNTGIVPRVYGFSGQVAPVSVDEIAGDALAPVGDATDLTRAVAEVVGNVGAANLLSVICLTDGGHNRGDSPEAVLPRLAVPLTFLAAGDAGRLTDLAVAVHRPPAVGFLNNQLRVEGEVRAIGIASPAIDVQVWRDGELTATITVALPPGERQAPLVVPIACASEGAFVYTLRVPRVPNELSTDNNETSFNLRVIKERLEVLFLGGRPGFDHGFLRQAVQSDPNAKWFSRVRIDDRRWLVQDEATVKPPANALHAKLDTVDVVIVQGLPAAALAGLAPTLRQRIEDGQTGLLVLSSEVGLQTGGWGGMPLGETLPFTLATEKYLGTPAGYELPAKDLPVEFLRAREDATDNLTFYRQLPRVEGLWTYGPLKPAAQVLLNSTLVQAGGPVPLLVAHRHGKGRVAVLLGAPLWPMALRVAAGQRDQRFFSAFAVNLMKWLANRREDAAVSIELPTSRAFVGQPVAVRVWVQDGQRQMVKDAVVSGTAVGSQTPEIRFDCLPTAEPGAYEFNLAPSRRDRLTLKVSARHRGAPLGTAETALIVEPPTAEFDQPEVQTELMARLASATGGVCRPIAEYRDALAGVKATPGLKREQITLEVRDSPTLLLMLILLPLGEWIFRRWRGLS